MEASRNDRDVFVGLLALYGLILFPILRANRYYSDDLKRALIGRTGWDSNGRPLTTLLMKLLQAYDHALIDISPLTQIGAVALLAWAGALIARRYSIRSVPLAALVAFPLGGQPFFLENLSYKFDALSMSLALFLALVPALACRDDRRGWWLGVAALFASLCLYQPAITAALVFVLLEVCIGQLGNAVPRQLLTRLLTRALQVGTAMLIYELTVGAHVNGWVKQRSETIHGVGELPRIGANFADFLGFIGHSFNEQWWLYIAPVLALLGLVWTGVGLRYALMPRGGHPARVRAVLIAAAMLMPAALAAAVFGPMLVLANPPIAPRLLIGVGALLSAALIVLQAALHEWRQPERWAIALAAVMAIGMASLASAYGNALGEQKSYEDRIAAHLADDLAAIEAEQPIDAILLSGSAGYAPATAHAIAQILIAVLIRPTSMPRTGFTPTCSCSIRCANSRQCGCTPAPTSSVSPAS
jgi:hypothetical protein